MPFFPSRLSIIDLMSLHFITTEVDVADWGVFGKQIHVIFPLFNVTLKYHQNCGKWTQEYFDTPSSSETFHL